MLILMYVQRRPLRLLPYFQTFFWASQEHLDDLRSCKTPGWTHECGFRVACFKNTWKIHGYSWILPWIDDSFKALRAINSSGDILETVTPTSKRTCRMQRRSKLSEHGKSLTHCGVSLVGKWLWDLMEWPLFTSANYVWEYIFVRRAEVCFAGCFQQFSGSTGGINKSYTFVVGNMGGHLPGCRQRADELGGWSGDLCFFGFATQKNNNWKHTEFNQFNGFSPKKKKTPAGQLKMSACILMLRPSALPKMASWPPLGGFFSALPSPKVYSSPPHLLHTSRSRHTWAAPWATLASANCLKNQFNTSEPLIPSDHNVTRTLRKLSKLLFLHTQLWSPSQWSKVNGLRFTTFCLYISTWHHRCFISSLLTQPPESWPELVLSLVIRRLFRSIFSLTEKLAALSSRPSDVQSLAERHLHSASTESRKKSPVRMFKDFCLQDANE